MARFALLGLSQLTTHRSAQRAVLLARPYATSSTPPPSDQSAKKGTLSNSNMIYLALGIAAATGGYWYYTHPDDPSTARKKARAQEDINRTGRESVDAVGARADETYHQGRVKYGEAKDAGQDILASARSGVNGKIQDAEERARQAAADAQAKYNSYKGSAQKTLADAKDSTENLYNEARSAADRRATEAKSGAEKKGEGVKAGWSNWLGWGKSEAEKGKREAAGKVTETAEDVRQLADKQA